MNDAAPLPAVRPTHPFLWSVRRELWENRSLTIAPLVAAGVVLFGYVISILHMPRALSALAARDPAQQTEAIRQPYHLAAVTILITVVIVSVVYCLGALYHERRDRSILFWKSLPVSDLTTVLAKISVPLLVLPAVACVVIAALQLSMLLVATIALVGHGDDTAALWANLPLAHMLLTVGYGVVALALWNAPVYAWLLLVSGWARRAPFLWAFLPPLALCLLEKVAFDTTHLGAVFIHRMGHAIDAAFTRGPSGADGSSAPLMLTPLRFLANPSLWLGGAVAVGLLLGAVWGRRRREPG